MCARIVARLEGESSFNAIPVPDPPVIRRGASGSFFYDKRLEGSSHHAVIPQRQHYRQIARGLASPVIRREKTVLRRHRAGLSGSTRMPDFRYWETTATLDVLWLRIPRRRTPALSISAGAQHSRSGSLPMKKAHEAQSRPPLRNGETAQLQDPKI